MKIALVRKEFLDVHGGAERYAVALAGGLADAGHEVHVFAGRFRKTDDNTITLHRVPFIARPSALKNLSFHRNARLLLGRRSFDIVNGLSQVYPQDVYRMGDGLHCHWLAVQGGGAAARLSRRVSPRHQTILMIERRIFSPGNYRRIIANSSLCKEQAQDYYDVPSCKIDVVHNGVDLRHFNPAAGMSAAPAVRKRFGLDPSCRVLLFAGHNFKRKGLDHALDCTALLKARGLRLKLLVAGRGRDRPFRRRADRLGLAGDIVFAGQVSDMTGLYGAADLLVHPALYEPFSNVCLEAMACGLPVVTTRHNGACEIIESRVNGIVIDEPAATRAATEAIEAVLSSGNTAREEMRFRAAARAGEYSMETNVRETLAVYRAALEDTDERRTC